MDKVLYGYAEQQLPEAELAVEEDEFYAEYAEEYYSSIDPQDAWEELYASWIGG